MIKKYLIQLIPQSSFFFGSERTFGQGDDTNYFVKSNYFPQQTALLGLLRYMTLEKEGMLDEPASVTSKLIGTKGFPNDNYGKIKSLSPLFIRFDEQGRPLKNYIVQAKDWAWKDKREDGPIQLTLEEKGGKGEAATHLDHLYIMQGYKAKNEIVTLLTEAGGTNWKEFNYDKDKVNDPHNGIFVEHKKAGIKKTYAFDENGNKGNRQDEEEDAFYRQTMYKLLPGYSFAFYAALETDTDGKAPIKDGLTVFGAEKSPFLVKITEAADAEPAILFRQLFTKAFGSRNSNQIILTSDSYIEKSFFNYCKFSINAQVDFRYIITPQNVKGKEAYSAMSSDNTKDNKPYKSSKQNLVERGSVFYLKDGTMEQAKTVLQNMVYQTIGYNQFISYPETPQS